MESKDDKIIKFFDAIRRNNVAEINRLFKDSTIRPWEFVEDDNNTGNKCS